MSNLYGADVEQLRNLANSFTRASEELDNSRRTVGEGIRISAWVGPFATRFRGQWDSDHARAIVAVSAALKLNAQQLRRNADEQDRASSGAGAGAGGGSSSTHVPGVVPASDPNAPTVVIDGRRVEITTPWVDPVTGLHGTTREYGDAGPVGEGHARAWVDEFGNAHAVAGISGSLGVTSGSETDVTVGDAHLHREDESFSGIRGDLGAEGNITADGASVRAGGGAFVGSEVTARGSVEVAGVTSGVAASLQAGVGATAHVGASVSPSEIKLEAEVGISIGVGFKIKPSISFSPKKIIDFFTH